MFDFTVRSAVYHLAFSASVCGSRAAKVQYSYENSRKVSFYTSHSTTRTAPNTFTANCNLTVKAKTQENEIDSEPLTIGQ